MIKNANKLNRLNYYKQTEGGTLRVKQISKRVLIMNLWQYRDHYFSEYFMINHLKMKSIFYLLCCFFMLLVTENLSAQAKIKNIDLEGAKEKENLNVFQQWIRWNNPGSLLMNHLIKQADVYYAERDREIANLQAKRDWEKRQKLVKNKLLQIVGPFPEKTPLNTQITGILHKDGYSVEKIVYEAMPDFYVTGCLFIPDGLKGKAPAILNVIGHSQPAFRAELYQTIILNLVKKGMIVFAIDPPGQGERVQYYDPKINLSSIGYSVIEHCYFGNQCLLSGTSCAKYFIWDGIRAIDYLLTRKEVDAAKIGVTGLSGGGTVTSYISAFDDRVSVRFLVVGQLLARDSLKPKESRMRKQNFTGGLQKGLLLRT